MEETAWLCQTPNIPGYCVQAFFPDWLSQTLFNQSA